jgi:IMP and pyridine-specific 5'-nucleotidase
VRIGIVTAAGYPTAAQYYARLHGLLDAVATSPALTPAQRTNLVVMGGEANYLFEFDAASPHRLALVPPERWMTPEMAAWSEPEIASLLDAAEAALRERVAALAMPANIIRKERAVGIVPNAPGVRILPESLEETVLAVERALARMHPAAQSLGSATSSTTTTTTADPAPPPKAAISFCAFNGGRDVFVDIGDKSWGVRVCQDWFGRRDGVLIRGENTLHVGDQFLSAGANDYKARTVSTTAWIASPAETVELLDELVALVEAKA